MSDSVRPHRRQPTRLPRPWDSPGKNTGVGCHFLLQCMKVKSESEVAQSCPTLSDPMDCSPPGSPSMGLSRQEHCLLLGTRSLQARVGCLFVSVPTSSTCTAMEELCCHVTLSLPTYLHVSSRGLGGCLRTGAISYRQEHPKLLAQFLDHSTL